MAATDPKAIISIPIDINEGVTPQIANELADKMGFKVHLFFKYNVTIFNILGQVQRAGRWDFSKIV